MNALSSKELAHRKELVKLANSMLRGEANLIEGVRRICILRFAIGDAENEVFLPIRGVESETDEFPVGEVRQHCSADQLRRIDMELDDYLANVKDIILNSCREIIKQYS